MIEQGTLLNFVGGSWQRADAPGIAVHNPATGEVLSKAPLSPAAAVARRWTRRRRRCRPGGARRAGDRIQPLFRLKALLDAEFREVARLITQECGKTLAEAEGELRRGIENVEVASGIPSLMMGSNLEDIASGIDELMIRQPVGVVGVDHAVQLPRHDPAVVPALRGRLRQHADPEAVGEDPDDDGEDLPARSSRPASRPAC